MTDRSPSPEQFEKAQEFRSLSYRVINAARRDICTAPGSLEECIAPIREVLEREARRIEREQRFVVHPDGKDIPCIGGPWGGCGVIVANPEDPKAKHIFLCERTPRLSGDCVVEESVRDDEYMLIQCNGEFYYSWDAAMNSRLIQSLSGDVLDLTRKLDEAKREIERLKRGKEEPRC